MKFFFHLQEPVLPHHTGVKSYSCPYICISFPINSLRVSSPSVYHLKFIYKIRGHKRQTKDFTSLDTTTKFLRLSCVMVCRHNGFHAQTFEILTQWFWAQYKGKIYLENCSLVRFNTRGPKVTKRLFWFFCMKSGCLFDFDLVFKWW
jgi:hypothetical protein